MSSFLKHFTAKINSILSILSKPWTHFYPMGHSLFLSGFFFWTFVVFEEQNSTEKVRSCNIRVLRKPCKVFLITNGTQCCLVLPAYFVSQDFVAQWYPPVKTNKKASY